MFSPLVPGKQICVKRVIIARQKRRAKIVCAESEFMLAKCKIPGSVHMSSAHITGVLFLRVDGYLP